MIQLNLLPDVKKEFLKAQGLRNMVVTVCIITTVAFVAVLIVLYGIIAGQIIKKNGVTDDIKKNAATIANAQDKDELDEYLTVQNQLSKISALKEEQQIYSRLFEFLQKLNPAVPNNAELTTVRVIDSTSYTIELEGSTKDFQSLNVYKTTLENAKISYVDGEGSPVKDEALFESVQVVESSISQSSEVPSVTFQIQVVYNPAAFASSTTTIDIKIDNVITSDSDISAPKAFKQKADGIDSNTNTEAQ
jgi:Tfp pilus assembly protein PilN